MKKFRTHYDNLNVARNADIAVIKAAYKALAQKYHPDRNPDNPNAERIMKIINTAYQVLIDPVRRAEHDRWIDEQERRAGQSHQSTNQSSNAYQNTASGSSSAGHSNEHASQNTHHQTNGYQRYYEYANGNQDKHSHQNDDKHNSNNQQKHYYKNDNYNDDRKIANKPSFWSFGRMRRTTYALFSIPTLFVVSIIRAAMEGAVSSMDNYSGADLFLMTIIELLPFYFLIFIGIKRLHDCDYKGWWILVPFVVVVIWFVRPTQGTNRFGNDPRDDYFDGDIEIESDYSFWGVVAISILINISLINNALEIQKSQIQSSVEQNHIPTYQDNQPGNTQIPNISSDDIVIPNINNEPQLNPQLVLAEAQKQYDNAVANINAVWSSLPPSTQEFLRAEQRAINKNRETDCTVYGNAQSTDKDLAKAYRYLCEVPQLNERAEHLKTQVNTVVSSPSNHIPSKDEFTLSAMINIYNNPQLAPPVPICQGDIYCNAFSALSQYWIYIPDDYRYQGEFNIKYQAQIGDGYGLNKGFTLNQEKSVLLAEGGNLTYYNSGENAEQEKILAEGLAVLLYIEDINGWF